MDIHAKKYLEYIDNADIANFKKYMEENKTENNNALSTTNETVDIFCVACVKNRLEIVKLIINSGIEIKSDIKLLIEIICKKNSIDILSYFLELIALQSQDKLQLHPSVKLMLNYMDSMNGLRYYGYNMALFNLEEDVVKLLKSKYECRLFIYQNYPYPCYNHGEQMLELHNKN